MDNRMSVDNGDAHGPFEDAKQRMQNGETFVLSPEDVVLRGHCEETLLHVACGLGHLVAVTALVNAGSDVNACDHNGNTPLYVACSEGHLEIVAFLLQHTAADFRPTRESNTPLHAAVSQNRLEVVKYLVEIGKHPLSVYNNNDCTPLDVAIVKKIPEIINYLLGHTLVPEKNTLCLAVAFGPALSVLQHWPEAVTSWRDDEGGTLLWCATTVEAARYLITHAQLNVNHVNKRDETALFAAASYGFLEVVRYFVEELGADPLRVRPHWPHYSPLGYAVLFNHLAVLEFFFDFLQRIGREITFNHEQCLFEHACFHGNLEVVQFLFERGYATIDGVESAVSQGRLVVVEWMLGKTVEIFPRLELHHLFRYLSNPPGRIDIHDEQGLKELQQTNFSWIHLKNDESGEKLAEYLPLNKQLRHITFGTSFRLSDPWGDDVIYDAFAQSSVEEIDVAAGRDISSIPDVPSWLPQHPVLAWNRAIHRGWSVDSHVEFPKTLRDVIVTVLVIARCGRPVVRARVDALSDRTLLRVLSSIGRLGFWRSC